jgi:hypothetical protein
MLEVKCQKSGEEITMFARVRKHMNPATGIAFMALIFAVTGVSFAATGGSGSGSPAKATASVSRAGSNTAVVAKKKAAPKPVRGPAGPKGATGATGATGPAGPAGTAGGAGPQGPQGVKGENGTNGTNGTDGTNGEKGERGETGYTEFLPAEKTETGTWGFRGEGGNEGTAGEGEQFVSISFPIPLEKALANVIGTPAEEHAHFVTKAEEKAGTVPGGCQGGSFAKPTAKPGNLCVYESIELEEATLSESFPFINTEFQLKTSGVGKTGVIMDIVKTNPIARGYGNWAVTAPEA